MTPHMRRFVEEISPAVREHGDKLADPVYFAEILKKDGIERAVVLPEHCPETSGNVRTETVLALCAKAADFLIPFASVHPFLDDDPATLLSGYIQRGVRGLKLYPSYQFFYPNDRRLYPVYEVCQAAKIPLLLHIGSSVVRGTRLKYCDPIHLDDVAVDFPDLPIVMAHGGRGFWYEACAFLASHFQNVFIDVTGLVPQKLLHHFPGLEQLSHKVVFGTDWPAMPKSPRQNIEAIVGLGLSEAALDRIFYQNAAHLLKLS